MTDVRPAPILTTDIVLMTIRDRQLQVLLHRRARAPYAGMLALPGGFIRTDEDGSAEEAAARILREKAGLPHFYMEQLATWSGRVRDPRGFSVSVVFLALVPSGALPDLPEDVGLYPVKGHPATAFDHAGIIDAAFRRIRGKGGYSTLPAMFLGETFTLPELQEAYGVVTGMPIDESSFRRKITAIGLIEDTGEMKRDTRRPSKLWRLAPGIATFDRPIA